eukprot:EG_transcript_5688
MCGIAFIRLLKPVEYYHEKYGTPFYAMTKLYLLMLKQQNRGQDGAGVANVKFDAQTGKPYFARCRRPGGGAVDKVFQEIKEGIAEAVAAAPEHAKDAAWLKENADFTGEVWLGHLRYGTYGGHTMTACHPHVRASNYKTRTLILAGNFNLTNVDDLFGLLVNIGQHPVEKSDTVTILEKIGHFLDLANDELVHKYRAAGHSAAEISELIARDLDLQPVLQRAAVDWDGGYAMAGVLGCGDAFVMRDPSGIRPAFYFQDDELLVVCSERAAIQAVFHKPPQDIKEITPGHAIIVKKSGKIRHCLFRASAPRTSCSFERIYFSRGADADIYAERKKLGRNLVPKVAAVLQGDVHHAVFSYIPNTAETAFYGLLEGLQEYLDEQKLRDILALGSNPTKEQLRPILARHIRAEKLANKDTKLRTFINDDASRDDMVSHVYDVTYGCVQPEDSLVVIDDSIVRGTTLNKSILSNLNRLGAKRIVFVSSCPQIRYPDCYGIDMAKLGDLCAFRAAIDLLKERGDEAFIHKLYEQAKAQQNCPMDQITNVVTKIYDSFTPEEISAKIAQNLGSNLGGTKVIIVFQSLQGLRDACPNHRGVWYFNGEYPTAGGNQVVNRAFINYYEGRNERAY